MICVDYYLDFQIVSYLCSQSILTKLFYIWLNCAGWSLYSKLKSFQATELSLCNVNYQKTVIKDQRES